MICLVCSESDLSHQPAGGRGPLLELEGATHTVDKSAPSSAASPPRSVGGNNTSENQSRPDNLIKPQFGLVLLKTRRDEIF